MPDGKCMIDHAYVRRVQFVECTPLDEHPYTFHLTFWLTMLVCNQGEYMVTR